METTPKGRFSFGDYSLDTHKKRLFDVAGASVPLMPKAYATLEYLVANPGRTVGKDELMTAVWGDTAVEENNLNQSISAIRKALGEKRGENRYIATIPGIGYEFVSAVTAREAPWTGSSRPSTSSEFERESSASLLLKRPVLITGAVSFFLAAVLIAAMLYPGVTPAHHSPESLAILPFRALDDTRSDEALELGMTDTLISRMREGIDLPVRSFSEVRRFGSSQIDPVFAGKELGVDAVLDGSVQTTADRVRVSVSLIRTDNGKQLWHGKFDEDLGDIFSVQDSIAERVASALQMRLKAGTSLRGAADPEAYRNYLKGRHVSFRLTVPNVTKAIRYYEKAIEIDPGYAAPYAGLADAYRSLVLSNDYPPRESMEKAKAAALKAVELDPRSADSQTALAFVYFWYEWDWKRAEMHFKRAIDSGTANAAARAFYAHFLSNMGRHREAVAEIGLAKDLDPRNPLVNSIEGQILFYSGDLGNAKERLTETIALEGTVFLPYLMMAKTLEGSGEHIKAAENARKAYELSGGNAECLAMAAYSLAKAGRRPEAMTAKSELEALSRSRYVPPYHLAVVDLALGERARALSNLERAFEERNLQMVFLKVDPKWNELSTEPRFIELLKKMRMD